MGTLQHDLKMVLEVEREGEEQLERARAEAQRLIEGKREEARQLLVEAERSLDRWGEERSGEVEKEIEGIVAGMEDRFRKEENRLRRLAGLHRSEAVDRLIQWLYGERR